MVGVENPVICVFCGSSPGTSPSHLEAARKLAHAFHENSVSLVYGGGTVGVMGELARTLVSLSGPDAVHGVIPSALLPLEAELRNAANQNPEDRTSAAAKASGQSKTRDMPDEKVFGRMTEVPDMHTRKRLMANLVQRGGPGSGFIALPGGYGTLEELMEVVTWNQLGIHQLGVCVYNVDGYWDGILNWVRQAVPAGFVSEKNSSIMVEAKDAKGAVKALQEYQVSEGRFKLSWEDTGKKDHPNGV